MTELRGDRRTISARPSHLREIPCFACGTVIAMGRLAEVLRAHLTRPNSVDEVPARELEAALAELVRAGASAWPSILLADEVFIGRAAGHCSHDETLLQWLEGVRAADLFLASACAERVPHAIDTFDRELLAAVPAILARGGLRDISADEVRQRVRERLFVGATKIADYSGRGSLASWLHVVTLRIGIDALREQRAHAVAAPSDDDDLRAVGTDPELSLIKERYRGPFKQALRAALHELSAEQRNLLKLHFVDGVTLEKLSALFHVHRATVVRRIAQAREEVFERVRLRLQAELGIDAAEFGELLVLLRSRLELSLSALLPTLAD
jgi:RNA polymerase sigma-70 factor (ECF subfamily)